MIEDLGEKITAYYALRPFQYSVVKEMKLHLAVDPIGGTGEWQEHLTLRLARNYREDCRGLQLELFGVRDLRFEQPVSCPFSLYLEIAELREKSSSQVRFVISNTEQDVAFTCVCYDFIAALVPPDERIAEDA